MRSGAFLCMLVSILSAATAIADTITVSWDGSGDYQTIQEGIDAAMDGDEVVVSDGVYTGDGNRDLDFAGRNITLRSENGPENCIIDCQSSQSDRHRGFYFYSGETPAAGVDGFTITAGSAYWGSAIHIWGSNPTIRNCTIVANGNTGSQRGSIYYQNATGIPIMVNCVIVGNRARDGGGIYCSNSNPRIINCTISGNTATWGGAIYAEDDSAPIIANSILWGNEALFGPEIYLIENATLTVTYCDVEGGEAGAYVEPDAQLVWDQGNIDVDPAFAFPADRHLVASSPCVDTGTNNPPGSLPPDDQDGNARPLDGDGDGGSLADMGAYEYNRHRPSLGLNSSSVEMFGRIGEPNPDAILRVRNCGGGTLRWQIEADCDWLQAVPASGQSTGEIDQVVLNADITLVEHGTHTCTLTIRDRQAVNSPRFVEVTLYLRTTLRVPSEFATIQSAIDAAVVTGDVVLVADGVYTGLGNKDLDFDGKDITVRSENGPESCVIDCEGDGSGFYIYERVTDAAVIEGLTIRNASTSGIVIVVGNPTIRNCTISGNSARYAGAGIYAIGSPTIINCTISGNRLDESLPVLGGAGIYSSSNLTLRDCVITGNVALGELGRGGALTFGKAGRATISGCIISDNSAVLGGAIASWGSSHVDIQDSIISGNTAVQSAGAIYDFSGGLTLRNCALAGNSSGSTAGVLVSPNAMIANCTITANTAKMSYALSGGLDISNCIIFGNSGDQIGYARTVTYSNVEGGWPGTGNIDLDPLFLDPDDDDYRLAPVSPCIDAGDNSAVPPDVTKDLDGNPRFLDHPCVPDTGAGEVPLVDMGAYEHPFAFVDCNVNGESDACEILKGFSSDCNGNGVPDKCDLADGTSQDCNGNGVPDECDPDDCNGNGVADECDLANGTSEDCNRNGVPDECDPDCNDNGVPDECDVVNGTSEDCNANGVPDECDVAGGNSADCDFNGVPDECENLDPLEITEHPESALVCAGDLLTLTVATNRPVLSYQWRKDGSYIPGARSDAHVIDPVRDADAGNYDVVVSDNCDALISDVATVIVGHAPIIHVQPTSKTVCAGDSAAFLVLATGDSLRYQWRKDGEDIPGATDNFYVIVSVSSADAGVYRVAITSECGATVLSERATLTVESCFELGDMNCDGAFDGGDIDPFFLALGDPAAYEAAFPDCDILNGDINDDASLDGADIDAFFDCLGGGACP